MPRVDKHIPGSFCWIELETSNLSSSQQFYSGLFGWTSNDVGALFQLGGSDVASACNLKSEGVYPHWNLYAAVENVDACASKAVDLGATILVSPFEVGDRGRMAAIKDPTGATFNIWQGTGHHGVGVTGIAGTMCWADLSTPDPARAAAFYSDLFAWQLEASENDKSGYLHIKNKGEYVGGVPPASHRSANMPAHWLIYFAVENCDVTAARAEALGARLILPPISMPGVGRMSVIADPEGAVFATFQNEAVKLPTVDTFVPSK